MALAASYLGDLRDGQVTMGIFYGIALILVLYHLYMFLAVRQYKYLFFSLFVLFFSAFEFVAFGFKNSPLLPMRDRLPQILAISLSVTSATLGVLFARSFLDLRKRLPRFDVFIVAFLIFCVAGGAAANFLPFEIGRIVAATLLASCLIFSMATSLAGFRTGHSSAFFFIAWAMLLVLLLVSIVRQIGFLNEFFFLDFLDQTGVAVAFLLFAYSLAGARELERPEATSDSLELQLRTSFDRFVPNQFAHLLNKNSVLELSNTDAIEVEVPILFSKIANFNSLYRELEDDRLFSFLNIYFSRMSQIVTDQKGFINGFNDDEITAIFPHSVDDALRAATFMHRGLEEVREFSALESQVAIAQGIGIHLGKVTMGAFGSAGRMAVSVIGENVRLVRLLEMLTRTFQVPVLVSAAATDQISEESAFHLRTIDYVRFGRNRDPVRILELLDAGPSELIEQKEAIQPDLQKAMQHYRDGQFDQARDAFQDCHHRAPADPIPGVYLERCSQLIEHPPGSQWTGYSRIINDSIRTRRTA